MGYNAEDEDLFSNKNKIILDRYDELRNELKNTIRNYNGIKKIYDNPTASAYPYINKKQSNTYINQNYRDRQYISIDNASERDIVINYPHTHTTDITPGFYRIALIGGGSGGIAISAYNEKCTAKAGNGGACVIVDVYFPVAGTLKYTVGDGSQGLLSYVGKTTGTFGADAGGTSEVFFNNDLVLRCYGGNKPTIRVRAPGWFYERALIINNTKGGSYELGAYINNVIVSLNGSSGAPATSVTVNGRDETIRSCSPTYNVSPFDQYGVGGQAQATLSGTNGYATKGSCGYFSLKSLNPQEIGFLSDEIFIESNKIHTLGNENNIRRVLKNALNISYNTMVVDTPLTKDVCNVIGEETSEESTCEPYSDDALINNPTKLFEVKKSGKNGYFSKDLYVVTYDNNTKRKLTLNNYKRFLDNSMMMDSYTPFIYNDDIIYVKNLPSSTSQVDIYKFIDNDFIKQENQGQYIKNDPENWESSTTNKSFNMISKDNGYANITLVGGGGGAGGTSNHKRWKTPGGVGGSGAYFKGIYRISEGFNISINTGQGGRSGIGYKQGGETGATGGASTFSMNNTIYAKANGGTGGQGGGKGGGNDGPSGYGGTCEYLTDRLERLIVDKRGNGGPGTVKDTRTTKYRTGNPSVYTGTNYGAGAPALEPDYGGEGIRSIPGENGYTSISIVYVDKLIYNGNIYELYDGDIITSNVIYWNDYLYDLEKLNRLKEYVATKDSWFDNQGYCQRSCQINCQTDAQVG